MGLMIRVYLKLHTAMDICSERRNQPWVAQICGANGFLITNEK